MLSRKITALGASAVAAIAVASPAGAQTPAPTPQTLTVKESADAVVRFVDLPPKSRRQGSHRRFSVGDAVVFVIPVRDQANHPIGRVRATCWITKPGGFDKATSDCTGVFTLAGGRLYVTLPLSFTGSEESGTVLSGTGAYSGLHGTWTSVDHRDGTSTDTFTLTP